MTSMIRILLPLKDIDLFYYYKSSEFTLKKNLKYYKANDFLNSRLTVSPKQNGDGYNLIDGYLPYQAFYYENENQCQICNLKLYDEKTQLLSSSRELFTQLRTPWVVKYRMLNTLKKYVTRPSELRNHLNLNQFELKRYDIHLDVPPKYINKGIELNVGPMLNKVCSLNTIKKEVRDYLYEITILETDNPKRLTTDNWHILKYMLRNSPQFYSQNTSFQIQFIENFIINYKTVLTDTWNHYLDSLEKDCNYEDDVNTSPGVFQ
jgi:hypothetical protein